MLLIGIDPAIKNVGLALLDTTTGEVGIERVDWSGGVAVNKIDACKMAEPFTVNFLAPMWSWLDKADRIFVEKPYSTGTRNTDISKKLTVFVNLLCFACPQKVHYVDPKVLKTYFNLGKPPTKGKFAMDAKARYRVKKANAVTRAMGIVYESGCHYWHKNQDVYQQLYRAPKKDDVADAILVVYYGWATTVFPRPMALEAVAKEGEYATWLWNLYMSTEVGTKILQSGLENLSSHFSKMKLIFPVPPAPPNGLPQQAPGQFGPPQHLLGIQHKLQQQPSSSHSTE